MATERLPMRKIRDVLRLHASGLSKRQIAASLSLGPTSESLVVLQIRKAACRCSPRNYEMRRTMEGISPYLRRDIGLPSHGSTFFISRDTSRCSEPYDADLYSASYGSEHREVSRNKVQTLRLIEIH